MSTYLVAILVSDFTCRRDFAEPVYSKNVSVTVCARTTAYDQLDLALESSVSILEEFEKFYQVEYPLPKLGNLILIILKIIFLIQ